MFAIHARRKQVEYDKVRSCVWTLSDLQGRCLTVLYSLSVETAPMNICAKVSENRGRDRKNPWWCRVPVVIPRLLSAQHYAEHLHMLTAEGEQWEQWLVRIMLLLNPWPAVRLPDCRYVPSPLHSGGITTSVVVGGGEKKGKITLLLPRPVSFFLSAALCTVRWISVWPCLTEASVILTILSSLFPLRSGQKGQRATVSTPLLFLSSCRIEDGSWV